MDLDKLGPWPILQTAAAILLVAGPFFLMYRAYMDKKSDAVPPGAPPEARWFFEGPLNIALTYLRDIAKTNETMARELQQHGEASRQQSRLLEEIERKINRRE